MKHTTSTRRTVSENQFGQLMRHALNDSAQDVPDHIAEQLRASRRKALAQRKQTSQERNFVQTLSAWFGNVSGSLVLATPVLMLAFGIYVISENATESYVQSVAEIDTQVLTQEVPLDALLDKGFVRYVQVGE